MIEFVIDDDKKVKNKLEMLQSIEDIQVATRILDQGSGKDESIIESNYKKLNTELNPLDRKVMTFPLSIALV
jgi:poly [ADP-ribose] polymerase 2/3/4